MAWYTEITEHFKKKICRYLLTRFLGQFLQEKLSLEQLSVDFYKGTGTVCNVTLYAQALNEICEEQGWNIEVICGEIGSIHVTVPWNSLMADNSFIEIENLSISLRPIARERDGVSMLESMWSSMSSSRQLAQDCLESETAMAGVGQEQAIEGLECFANTIDNVLNRTKALLINTEIRLEYTKHDSNRGVALLIKVERLEYKNDAGNSDPPDKLPAEEPGNQSTDNRTFISTHSIHNVTFIGVTFYTEEFQIITNDRQSQPRDPSDSMMSSAQYHSTISDLPETDQSYAKGISNRASASDDIGTSDTDSDSDSSGKMRIQRSDMIMIGQLSSKQEIIIKMKQTTQIPGPKVILDASFDAFTMFLTPRQLHLLLLYGDVLTNSPATSPEQQHQEQQQQQTQRTSSYVHMASGLSVKQGWSVDPSGQSEQSYRNLSIYGDGPSYMPPLRIGGRGGGFNDVMMSSNSSMTSSMCSTMTQSTQNTIRARRRGIIEMDPNADVSALNIRFSCCAIVLLHEDVLVESTDNTSGSPLSDRSVHKLKSISDNYFKSIVGLNGGLTIDDLKQTNQLLTEACGKLNHLRLFAAPIIFEGEEQRNVNGNLIRMTASIARSELIEMLHDEMVPLLKFHRDQVGNSLPIRPEISLRIKQTVHNSRMAKYIPSVCDILLSFAPCVTEIDVSIIDRLHGLFKPSPFIWSNTDPTTEMTDDTKLNITIESDAIDVKLRFPIPDMRPVHDPNRLPHWLRNVRPDYLQFNFVEFKLLHTLRHFEISGQTIDVFYLEHDQSAKIPIARTEYTVEIATTRLQHTETKVSPRLIIDIPNEKKLMNAEQVHVKQVDDDSDSFNFPFMKREDPTPFSSQRTCRQSDIPHKRPSTATNNDSVESDSTLLTQPGDAEEMKIFCDEATKTARLQIQISLPIASLQLKSKHLYEIIYNRINTDLLLWTPCEASGISRQGHVKMSTANSTSGASVLTNLLNAGMTDSLYVPYEMCKSEIDFEDSSSTEGETDSDAIYYSAYEKRGKSIIIPTTSQDRTSSISLQLNIGNGILTMYAPVRDSQNRVIPGQLGEFVIKVVSTTLFSVNKYRGDTNLGYLCLHTKSAELYHFGLIPVPSPDPPLRLTGCKLPVHIQSTLYGTPKNISLFKRDEKMASKREMISLAVRIKAVPDQRIKRIKVAAGIQGVTLRHNFARSEHTWITQLIDMFNVLDYEISGYTPFGVVTEMHLHLWDSTIDYRPLYLNYRALVTLGALSISSNITTGAAGCTLRFIAEDSTLCLAQYKPNIDREHRHKITALSSDDLVCVLDLSLFEMSYRMFDKPTVTFPQYDFRGSMSDTHIRTCSDSAIALAKLIIYIARATDLRQISNDEDGSERKLSEEFEHDLLKVISEKPIIQIVDEVQQERVNLLMEEAMKESLRILPSTSSEQTHPGVEVFFFPDEGKRSEPSITSSTTDFSNELDMDSRSLSSSKSQLDDGQDVQRVPQSDTDSADTELNEMLCFESSMMGLKTEINAGTDTLPQVATELGIICPPRSPLVNRKISSDTDDEYCFIGEEERPQCGFDTVEMTDDPIRIVDNHFSVPIGKPDLLLPPPNFPMAVIRYTICEMSFVWHVYGGNDFPVSDDSSIPTETVKSAIKSQTPKSPMSRSYRTEMSNAYKMGVSYSKGSPNVSFSKRFDHNWKERGGPNRDHTVLMDFCVNKARFSYEIYPSDSEQASRQVLLITEYEIRDRLTVSDFNKFLHYPNTARKGTRHMLAIKALNLRPNRLRPAHQECCLRISMLPLRLNIDQDALSFLVTFFTNLSNGSNDFVAEQPVPVRVQQPPFMMVDVPISSAVQQLQARKIVSENLNLLMGDDHDQFDVAVNENIDMSDDGDSPIYFKSVEFSPGVKISLDYHGKNVDMSKGRLAGVLLGLGQLQCTEIELKKVIYRRGLLGVDRLMKYLLTRWLDDIKKNQIPSVLRGLSLVNCLFEFIIGFINLFRMPIEQYNKDGRIVRGIQLGAQSFTASTALAALEITTRFIHILQVTSETAYDMLSPGPSVRQIRRNQQGKRKRIHPPQDIREGVTNAYQIVKDGVGETAHTIVEMAALEHDQKGYTGAFGAVIRQIPPTVVRPIVLATQATTNLLDGVKNQLVPDARLEARDKWKDDDE